MSEEITELDMDIYLILKWEDIHNELSSDERFRLASMLSSILISRKANGKPQNQYLVLNLEDDIDIDWLIDELTHLPITKNEKVKKIAVVLVNAILKTKEK